MIIDEPRISVTVPLHNEAGNLLLLYREIKDVLDGLGDLYEIIFINDASTDATSDVLRHIKSSDARVRVIEHKENYGQAVGITTGFQRFRGTILITMDGDGQNDPHDIPVLLEKLREGYTVVTGWRTKRQEQYLTRILPSKAANWLISLVTGVYVHDNGCSLKAYQADVVRGKVIPHGFHRFLPAVLGVSNDDVAEVRVRDRKRGYGESHYGLGRIREVLRDLLTILFFIHHPQRWLRRFRHLVSGAGTLTLGLAGWILFDPHVSTLALALIFLGVTLLAVIISGNLDRVLTLCDQRVFVREEWDQPGF